MAAEKKPEKPKKTDTPSVSKKVTRKKSSKKPIAKKKITKKRAGAAKPDVKKKVTKKAESKTATPPKPRPAKATSANATSATKQRLFKIQYYRSAIGFSKEQKRVVKGLGFRRLNAVRELQDTPAVRGMIRKVPHLVRVVDE